MAGIRDLDPAEREALERSPATVVGAGLDTLVAVQNALDRAPVYVHLDVDVLDPEEMPAQFPVSGGMRSDKLYDLLEAVADECEIVGVEVTDTGLWKVVLRPSGSPQPVGIDGLISQWEHRGDLIRLCRTLTPETGRGIPLWLDIVDAEVRVTDPLIEAMVEEYIDPDLLHRLLVPKRSERTSLTRDAPCPLRRPFSPVLAF